MKSIYYQIPALLLFAFLIFTSCKEDESDEPVTESKVTDIVLTFNNPDTQTNQTFVYSDPDGEGGNAPTADVINLNTNGSTAAYIVTVTLRDASDASNVRDITSEIIAADETHQFFYIPNSEADDNVGINYNNADDLDENGKPLGRKSIWITSGSSTSAEAVRIVLRKDLDKNAAGVSDGEIANAGGTTLIDATFNLTIQ